MVTGDNIIKEIKILLLLINNSGETMDIKHK